MVSFHSNTNHNQDIAHMQLIFKYCTLSNLGVHSCSDIVTDAIFLLLSPFPAIAKDEMFQK